MRPHPEVTGGSMKKIIVLLVLALMVVSCGKLPGIKTAEPTKENAVQTLRDALTALEAKDYDKAATYFKVPANAPPDEVKKQLARLLEINELSSNGIDILARDGKWGKLEEVFGADRAKSMTERSGVPVDSCYGLNLRNAEAGFYWDGKQFKIIRCDDIGKL
jgi:hypothetical protein